MANMPNILRLLLLMEPSAKKIKFFVSFSLYVLENIM